MKYNINSVWILEVQRHYGNTVWWEPATMEPMFSTRERARKYKTGLVTRLASLTGSKFGLPILRVSRYFGGYGKPKL